MDHKHVIEALLQNGALGVDLIVHARFADIDTARKAAANLYAFGYEAYQVGPEVDVYLASGVLETA